MQRNATSTAKPFSQRDDYKASSITKALTARPARPDRAFAPAFVGGTTGPLLALGAQLVPQLVPKVVPAAALAGGVPDGYGGGVVYAGAPAGVGAPSPTEQEVVPPSTVMVEVVNDTYLTC